NEGLEARAGETDGQDLVVVLRRGFIEVQRGDDRAVRKRDLPFAKRLDRNVVAELSAYLSHCGSGQMVDGEQAPIAISVRNGDAIDRRDSALGLRLGLIGVLRRGCRHVRDANGDKGANAQEADDLTSDPKCAALHGLSLDARFEPSRRYAAANVSEVG